MIWAKAVASSLVGHLEFVAVVAQRRDDFEERTKLELALNERAHHGAASPGVNSSRLPLGSLVTTCLEAAPP